MAPDGKTRIDTQTVKDPQGQTTATNVIFRERQ
jgi:hypothetical protein